MDNKIYIDSNLNVYYASFYIKGLYDLFGEKNLTFNHSFFNELTYSQSVFNFIIFSNGQNKKISIDYGDQPEINDCCYEWCDIYGKVNTRFSLTPKEQYIKLISLAPGFGIQIWSIFRTALYASLNLTKKGSELSIRKFLGFYKRMHKFRSEYELYKPGDSIIDNYIFHLSTLWYNDSENLNDEIVNKTRANFIRVCKEIEGITFEGGLYYDQKFELNQDFIDVIIYSYLPNEIYIDKIKKSALVFNTPSFWQCHGWKLGEFLALGKAIISTPLSNDLPEPLKHGENIHIIENTSEQNIRDAIKLILNNPDYRIKLETGARKYWEMYGNPVQSLKLLGI